MGITWSTKACMCEEHSGNTKWKFYIGEWPEITSSFRNLVDQAPSAPTSATPPLTVNPQHSPVRSFLLPVNWGRQHCSLLRKWFCIMSWHLLKLDHYRIKILFMRMNNWIFSGREAMGWCTWILLLLLSVPAPVTSGLLDHENGLLTNAESRCKGIETGIILFSHLVTYW